MDDTVDFLQTVKTVFPDILAVLSDVEIRVLDSRADEPFDAESVNTEFVQTSEARFVSSHTVMMAKSLLRGALVGPSTKGKELDIAKQEKLIEATTKVHERIKVIIDGRLEATKEAYGAVGLPRVIRLARRYKMSPSESEVLVYCLVCSVARSRRASVHLNDAKFLTSDTLQVCRACNIGITEMMDFLSLEREHMQHGLFPDVMPNYTLQCSLTYDETVCRTLIGCNIKSSEFLKLEQTCLADVLIEESGGEKYRSGGDMSNAALAPNTQEDKDKVVTENKIEVTQDEDVVDKHSKPEEAVSVQDTKTTTNLPQDNNVDLDFLLKRERQREKDLVVEKDTQIEKVVTEAGEDDAADDSLKPYKTDLDYLDDNIQWVAQKLKLKQMDSRLEIEEQMGDEIHDTRTIRLKREAQSKLKVLENKCARRLAMTKQTGTWVPRLERMISSRKLCEFEKKVLLTLISNTIQPNKIMLYLDYHGGQHGFKVGDLLRLFCSDLATQIKSRVYFYKTASLVREGMIIVHASGLSGDPTGAKVEIDRRMLDFCVGLDTEFSEIVEGSHLYYPKTKFESVIVSQEQKDLIMSTVSNFESYKICRKRFGLDDAITYGAGMVMLFHGPPGTGKTMMANALANKLEKKVLLINFPSLGSMTAGENFKFIFREAKINDAILFFDECEGIFETREKGGHDINMLLTEIERHDGLIILATNRPYDLDEAMHRRIMLAIEFRKPDHLLRRSIWESHIPELMPLAENVNTTELALKFELSGGFIKNAVLSALSLAVSRDGNSPVVRQDDLLQGAIFQLRGHLRMKEFDRRVVPVCGLDEVLVDDDLAKSLRELVSFEKARSVLFGQWGFGKRMMEGVTALFHGLPGTGKSLAAEAVGYEVGRALKVVNSGELLSKWVGESTKNIDAIFEDGRDSDAILVFDEAEGLFGTRTEMSSSTDRYANVDVSVLLYHIERYPGIVILTTNLIDNIDKAFFRRLKFILHFRTPSRSLRRDLWKLLIPSEAPIADDIDFEELSYFEMNGGDVKSAVFRAASRAALRADDTRKITMKDLQEAAKEELNKTSGRPGFRRQDSQQTAMYS